MDEDYDDFSEVPKLLRYAYNLPVRDDKIVDLLLPPKKRHRKNYFIFQSILKRWGYSWDRISWKGRLVVGLISLGMFVVPIKILHIKWTKMKEEVFKPAIKHAN